jgi:hypothetical protein
MLLATCAGVGARCGPDRARRTLPLVQCEEPAESGGHVPSLERRRESLGEAVGEELKAARVDGVASRDEPFEQRVFVLRELRHRRRTARGDLGTRLAHDEMRGTLLDHERSCNDVAEPLPGA